MAHTNGHNVSKDTAIQNTMIDIMRHLIIGGRWKDQAGRFGPVGQGNKRHPSY